MNLKKPPIIEAVLDIDCELPPNLDIMKVQKLASKELAKSYPKMRPTFLQDHTVKATPTNEVEYSLKSEINGFQFLKNDGRQVVQFRKQGFSFNRLEPYTNLDSYLPQIKKQWLNYLRMAEPIKISAIRLRYINRILLPLVNGEVNLDEYIINGPRLADNERLSLVGFLDQYTAVDKKTGHQMSSVLTLQPIADQTLPLIFDNGVVSSKSVSIENWNEIRSIILELRELKNHIFKRTVTKRCLNLFR
ncbi:MAG TPA: TIGR04255 family protein [Pyrinomonadaceae bacterium]|nr:TIGR04255 family protein [Pyrinomonadaceae bacterium]